MNGPLVSLVQHDDGVLSHLPVNQVLPQQHAVCHVFDLRFRTCAVFKTNRVANLCREQSLVDVCELGSGCATGSEIVEEHN